jgi:hypothetical protein
MLPVQLKRMLRSQRGNALLMVLGVAAFVAAIGTEMYRRSEVTALRGKQAEFRDSTQLVMSTLESQLQNPESCTGLLSGQVLTPGAKSPVALNLTLDPGFPGPIQAGREILGNMTVAALALDPDPAMPMDPASFTDMRTQLKNSSGTLNPYRRFPVRLHATFQAKDNSLVAINRVRTASGIDLGLPLYVWTDATNRITTCFGANSSGSFCNSMGGYYVADGATPVDLPLRCRQSIYTESWINGAFVNRGSCRFGGYVKTPTECPSHLGSVYDTYEIQAHWDGRSDAGYLCMLCQ